VTARADVALGSNLGARAGWLASARAALSLLPATRLLGASTIEETIPFGASAQGPYLNQMVALGTSLEPRALLAALHEIERRLGRVRATRWGPRTIDLDLVRYDGVSMRTPALMLPHPGIATRPFWQRELAELDRILGRAA
jgi:2-amino-4-hydroxy-6-hydroxymethyldihydropteridine diphosphokinase